MIIELFMITELFMIVDCFMAAGSTITLEIWQGRKDSNLRVAGSKPAALPLGDAPVVLHNCSLPLRIHCREQFIEWRLIYTLRYETGQLLWQFSLRI
jgi:hypothetical protein